MNVTRIKIAMIGSIIFLLGITLAPPTLFASQFFPENSKLIEQRSFYKDLIENKDYGEIDPSKYQEQLADYPLVPYLEYRYLLNNLGEINKDQFSTFFEQHSDLAGSSYLRRQLLSYLGKNKQWQDFDEFYSSANTDENNKWNTEISCYRIQSQLAQIKTKPDTKQNSLTTDLQDKIKSLYLQGRSLPDACDPLFKTYEIQGFLNDSIKLQRMSLAIKNKKKSLAKFIGKSLKDRSPYELWQNLYKNPRFLEDLNYPIEDTEFNRLIITESLGKLLKKDAPLTMTLWKEQQKRFKFTSDEKRRFELSSATYLYLRDSEHFYPWSELASESYQDQDLNLKRLVNTIKDRDWNRLLQIYKQLSDKEKQESIWKYWYARAYMERDHTQDIHPEAYRVLEALSSKREYYGFLASLHLDQAPFIGKRNLPINEEALKNLAEKPRIMRAHEFYLLGDRINASREWWAEIKSFNPEQRGEAAQLAAQWGWLEQSIASAARSNQFNNISLRFPKGFSELVKYYATQYSIPNEWVFAVIRQESAYGVEAESAVGALGLMQIMPATGANLARENNLKQFKTKQLLDPKTNISLGTYYLAQLREKYDGNMLLASAAYNAGPSKVNRWKKQNTELPLVMWIETIPYKETRNYVKNILTYQLIYQSELGREFNPKRLFLPVNQD